MSIRYIAPQGTGDGSERHLAANFQTLNNQIGLAGPGGEVRFTPGLYSVPKTYPITVGSAFPGAPVKLIFEEGAEFRGNRASPWVPGAAIGNPLFRTDADNLIFDGIKAYNFGNGIIVSHSVRSGITFTNWWVSNVQRVMDVTQTINGLTITNGHADLWPKGVIRLAGDTNKVLIDNVYGDSQYVEGDPIPFGIHLGGTVHNVEIFRTQMFNAISKETPYWNGDGFVTEDGTYQIVLSDCTAGGHGDAGFDLKSKWTWVEKCVATLNKRNYRLWSNAILLNCTGLNPFLRGGTGTQNQIHINKTARVEVVGGKFHDYNPDTTFFQSEPGSGYMMVRDAEIIQHPDSTLVRAGTGSTIETLHLT